MFGFRICACLSALTFIGMACGKGGETLPPAEIVLNQVGYLSDTPKLAFYAGLSQPGDSFFVIDTQTGEPVYSNRLWLKTKKDAATGDRIYVLDFTELKAEGTYRVQVPALQSSSCSFNIGNDLYGNALKTALESFYYQRCGVEIDSAAPWTHPVCHLDDAAFYHDTNKRQDVSGGWHDAGDYGKFSVNTAVTLAFLLYLYDQHSAGFRDGDLDIPENENGIPDLLDEARWALDWLLKMQRDDGGVYHKVQKKSWTGEYLPHEDPDPRYIYEVSSTATADVAAVTALGAQLFSELDAAYAKALADAARRAWKFLEDNPDMVPKGGFKNPPDVSGGEYGDHQDMDERIWAAAELYDLTEDSKYHTYLVDNFGEILTEPLPPLSWKNVTVFALGSYLRLDPQQQDESTRKVVEEVLSRDANVLAERVSQNGYRIALEEDEYYWGSNSVALGYAFLLVQAFELTGKETYRSAALDQLHYILGRNPFGRSFVTGIGSHAVRHPYHQFSNELDVGRPVPGMVTGGPNHSSRLNGNLLSEYPGRAYEDAKKNYMVNEVAINYTAPLVYLLGYFSRPDHTEYTISSN